MNSTSRGTLPTGATYPDYNGGSIANLMSSISAARGHPPPIYPVSHLCDPARLQEFTNIVLLVIDGLGYNYIKRAGAGSMLHDYLEGRMTSVFPATTAAAIPTFLTGNPAQQHGLTGWFVYLREFNTVAAVLPYAARGSRVPLSTDIADPRQLTNQNPIFDRFVGRSHSVMPADIAYSTFNRALSGSAATHPYRTLDQMFDTVERIAKSDGGAKYIYAYWPGFDALAHEHGVSSNIAHRHFEQIDKALTRFKRHLAGADTIVIVTADHGFVDAEPEQSILLEDHPVLTETLMRPLCGEPRLAYCYVHPHKRKQFTAYVRGELKHRFDICPSRDLIAEGVYGLGQCHPELPGRIGHYALLAKDKATIKDTVAGERQFRDIGVHGGTSEDEMYVPFIEIAD